MPLLPRIAVFASGTGTTLQALIAQAGDGYRVALVVSNRPCMAIERAQQADIPTLLTQDWEAIDIALREQQVQMVVLAGFLAILPAWVCDRWKGRMINIHPSLLPKHGGKGMYGVRVQEAALAAGDKVAGCTVHYVSADIDGGAIIAQATVEVRDDDTAERLAQRVQDKEKSLLPITIKELLDNITIDNA